MASPNLIYSTELNMRPEMDRGLTELSQTTGARTEIKKLALAKDNYLNTFCFIENGYFR